MSVQITGSQIQNTTIPAGKLDLTGTFDFSSGSLRVKNSPTQSTEAVNKGYVDNLVAGISWKQPVKAASTANLTLSGTQTVDGIALVAGDRVLVKDQTDGKENGIYVVSATTWSRSEDMNADAEFPSSAVFVQSGSVNAQVGFTCTNSAVTVGSTAITFVQFNGASNIVAGAALSKTGNQLDVEVDGVTIEISADQLQLKDLAVDTNKLADSAVSTQKIANNAVTNAKLQNSTISGVSLGANLFSLSASASGAISFTAYNGSSASSNMAVNVNSAMLEIASNAISVKAGGIYTSELADQAVTTAKLADEAVTATQIADNAIVTRTIGALQVTSAKIANSAVTSTQLSDGAVTSSKIVDGSVVEVKLANGAVAEAKIADGAVTNAKLGNLSVATGKIQDSAVATAKIADSAVTNAKLAGSITADKLTLGQGVFNNSGSLQAKVDGSYIYLDGSQNIGLNVSSYWFSLSPNGSLTSFDLGNPLKAKFSQIVVYKNGLAMDQVLSPASSDEYSVSLTGGTNGVGQITFGSAPASNDKVKVWYIA